MLLRTCQRVLGQDYEIVVCTSCRDGLALVADGASFDAIVCDVMMSDVTGIEFHAALCKRDASLAARVIFMTGGVSTPEAEAFLAAAANPRLLKPFDIQQLRTIVRKVVNTTHAG